ncbi:hypothetical protein BHE74_00018369 [Ensete ventricosum]|nr:hypothetical protein BHE74_00018369 [Ensete ventricosum]RZR88586.1 hypothetical protein BHM03_00016207 [Ensete ventricosum]
MGRVGWIEAGGGGRLAFRSMGGGAKRHLAESRRRLPGGGVGMHRSEGIGPQTLVAALQRQRLELWKGRSEAEAKGQVFKNGWNAALVLVLITLLCYVRFKIRAKRFHLE